MAKFAVKVLVNENAIEAFEQFEELLLDGLGQTGEFFAGQRPEAPGKRSPLGRHFVKTNVKRYRWPPLSEPYATRKKAQYGNVPVLVRTGAMRNAFLGRVDVNAERTKARLRFSVPGYAKYHQEGGSVRGRPPKRAPLSVNKQDAVAMREFYQKFLTVHLLAAISGRAGSVVVQ